MRNEATGRIPEGRTITWLWAAATLILVAALVTAFVFIVLEVASAGRLVQWDRHITAFLVEVRTAGWNRVLWAFSLLGNTPLVVVFTLAGALLFATWGRRPQAMLMIIGVASTTGISNLLKAVLERARPDEALALIEMPRSGSLPSGHALVTAVFLGLVLLPVVRSRWQGWPATPLRVGIGLAVVAVAGLIGFSRVYLGVHWASDVIGGWCLGGAWLIIVVVAFRIWERTDRASAAQRLQRVEGWRVAVTVLVIIAVAVAAVFEAQATPLLG
ncbi:MAG: phosphatase PAP2 family protein [Thermoleophilia bacterium]